MTYLGTHDRYIAPRPKRELTEVGTELLENSLAKLLERDSRPTYDGTYGLVLPPHLRS